MNMILNLKKIPNDVIINNIVPYTYQLQNKKHLIDVRSFYADYEVLKCFQHYDYNDTIVLNDIIRYCNSNIAPIYDIEIKYEQILRRNLFYKNKTKNEIREHIFNDFHNHLLENTERKILFFWGLLTPSERSEFINDYYLLDEIYL